MQIHLLQHVAFEGPGHIADWANSRGHTLTITRLDRGAALPTLADFEWLIVMGGPMSVHDASAYAWMPDEKRLIGEAIAGGKTVLGICLGAQFVAEALGAQVIAGAHKEIGWWPVAWTADAGRLFGTAMSSNDVVHWHGETFALPAGARRLASSPACENQAFLFGDRVVGLQFHLEMTPAGIEALVANCPDDLAPGPYVRSVGELRAVSPHFERCHRRLDELLDSLSAATATLTAEG